MISPQFWSTALWSPSLWAGDTVHSTTAVVLPPLSLLCLLLSDISLAGNHKAETLTMLVPAELVVVWMLGAAGWPRGGGGLLCGGRWRPSASGAKAGGVGRLMMAVVMRPLLQLILLLSSVLKLRFERLLEKKEKQTMSDCCRVQLELKF